MNSFAPDQIRKASSEDASVCAQIKNDWIDETDWMPRVHPADDVERHYSEYVFERREVFVFGDPPKGYLALDTEDGFVTSLFVSARDQGIGKALLDRAKQVLNELQLWTFQANTGAIRFYHREGFVEIDRTDGDNEEFLPDVLMKWVAA